MAQLQDQILKSRTAWQELTDREFWRVVRAIGYLDSIIPIRRDYSDNPLYESLLSIRDAAVEYAKVLP